MKKSGLGPSPILGLKSDPPLWILIKQYLTQIGAPRVKIKTKIKERVTPKDLKS
jgi:hypothetical protein